MPNTNFQTIHQFGAGISQVVRQATGRDPVQNIDMEHVTVAQNKRKILHGSSSMPYMFRRTGGGQDIGSSNLESIKVIGGTVVWNQMINTGVRHNGITATKTNDGSFILSGTAESTYANVFGTPTLIAGHRYILVSRIIANPNNLPIRFGLYNNVDQIKNSDGGFIARSTGGNAGLGINTLTLGADYTNVRFFVRMHDITRIFGPAIANYIYSLETATAGSGIEWFRNLFPDDYYPYNALEMISVEATAHNTTGPDWEKTYPLDPDLTLRGIPRLDADNRLYYDGDIYESDGTVTRRYGIVDLGTLTWTKGGNAFTSTTLNSIIRKNTSQNTIPNWFINPRYNYNSPTNVYSGQSLYNKCISVNTSGTLIVNDLDYSAADEFKDSLSGVYLVYELATPATETADPYTDPQEISVDGTEEFISNTIVPVGNETIYYELRSM